MTLAKFLKQNKNKTKKTTKTNHRQRIPHFFQEVFFSCCCQLEKGPKELPLCDSSSLRPGWQGAQLRSGLVLRRFPSASLRNYAGRALEGLWGLSRCSVHSTGRDGGLSFTVRCTALPNSVFMGLIILLSFYAVWAHRLHMLIIVSLHMTLCIHLCLLLTYISL